VSFFGDSLDNPDDAASRTRTKKIVKAGRVFGQGPYDPPVLGRKRGGRNAGGWEGGWL
jgi:hypothetical protein